MFGEGETRLCIYVGYWFLDNPWDSESKSKNIKQLAQEHLCNPMMVSGNSLCAVKTFNQEWISHEIGE